MQKSKECLCHICGQIGKLTFEHVPPESAFNDKPSVYLKIQDLINQGHFTNNENYKGVKQQRGAGGYTLCEHCNTLTGKWYGKAFADWAHQAVQILNAAKSVPLLYYSFNIHPLRVIKQIVCMFFSANGPRFQSVNPELVKFVLNRDEQYLPSNIRVYAFYTWDCHSRSSGITGMINGETSVKSYVFSEITFPPFGFVMTFDSPPPDESLCDISAFSYHRFREWRASYFMKLPVKPIHTFYPGDYRTSEEIERTLLTTSS